MKILHVITRMDRGGSAVNTLLCAIEQQRLGHEVSLVYGCSIESDMSDAEKEKTDAEIQRFQSLGGRVIVLASMLRALGMHDKLAYRELKALMKMGFDIVHTHTSKAGALARLAAKDINIKVVHTPHGHIFHGYFGGLKTQIFIAIERYLAKKTDVLIALTRAERDDHLALRIGQKSQWRVIPSGVDVQAIMRQTEAIKGQMEWDAVSVGRLVPIKGMERLIKAWAEVCKIKPDAKLALVGDGEERVFLTLLAEDLGISENIHFAGWSNPVPYLAHTRCFALLSYNEGMGRAVVEALAAGLPCVVSDVCGLRELVDNQVGQVVNADCAKEVANALLTHWDALIGDAARIRAKNYSIETMISGLEKVYQDVCS